LKLIFKNLNVLRSTLNAIGMSFELKEIVDSAGINLPNLFDFISFGFFWRESLLIYLIQDESCPPSFTEEVVKNILNVFSTLADEEIEFQKVNVQSEKKRLRPGQMIIDPNIRLKSHLTLPLIIEGKIIGCISLNSDQPNAFDAQDLQFLSVIGYQMVASLKHIQRLSSIKNIAIYDTLTNLYNRRYFEERFEVETQKAFFSDTPLSLVMVDIDHFKKINDTLGHTEGDKVLKEISNLLKNSVRKKDTVARYGGEEFILILPDAGLEESLMIAERIRRLVENTTFEIAQAQIHLTVSLGIANFPSHRVRSKEDLIKMADQALYEAKRGGRNRVCIYNPPKT